MFAYKLGKTVFTAWKLYKKTLARKNKVKLESKNPQEDSDAQ